MRLICPNLLFIYLRQWSSKDTFEWWEDAETEELSLEKTLKSPCSFSYPARALEKTVWTAHRTGVVMMSL